MGGFGPTGNLWPRSVPGATGFITDGPILVAGRDQSTTDRSRNGHASQYAIGGHQTRKNGLNGNGRSQPRRLDRPLRSRDGRAHWKRDVACFSVLM